MHFLRQEFLLRLDLQGSLRTLSFSFKPSKSPGIHGIRAYDPRRKFTSLKKVLFAMLNGFITPGSIPDELKVAILRPLFKREERSNVANCRPISIVPILG